MIIEITINGFKVNGETVHASFFAISDRIKSNNTIKFEEWWNAMQYHLCDELWRWLYYDFIMDFIALCWCKWTFIAQTWIVYRVNSVDVKLKWTPSTERKQKRLPLNTSMVCNHGTRDAGPAYTAMFVCTERQQLCASVGI